MTGTTDDGRKDGTRSIVSSEAGLAHAGSIVADQSGNLVVAHFLELTLLRHTERHDANATQSVEHCTLVSHRRSSL